MGVLDAIMAPLVAQQQYQNDKMMYQQQYLDSIDFTNQMLAYNTPEKQIERLKAAGINPVASSMGQGGLVTSGNQVAPAQLPTPVSHDYASGFATALSALGNNRLANAQAKTEDELRELRKEQINRSNEKLLAETQGLQLSNDAQAIVNKYVEAREAWAVQESKSRSWLNYSEVRKSNKEYEKLSYEISTVLPAEVSKILSERDINVLDQERVLAVIKDTYASAELKEAQKELTEEQKNTEQVKQVEMSAETQKVEQEMSRYDEITDAYLTKYGAEVANLAANTNKTEEEVFWMVFDKYENTSLQLLGSKFSRSRFGQSSGRKAMENRIKDRYGFKFGSLF